jgi:LmbE family N-acetylglucosaminyl deacetylase
MKPLWMIGAGLTALALAIPHAQMRVVPLDDQQGHVALGLELRHLANTGIVMQATAHPDDEDNGLLVMLNRGEGFRTALATATRGNGGQNEIGPEIFEALGVLRTAELEALHRFDGAEQYFTRAVDFGYSFSLDETFEKWGRDEIVGDYVRLIRMIRPDVIFALSPRGEGGGQHHQASAILSHEAYKLAGDPAKYPEQLRQGLRPWQPKKFYDAAGFGPGAAPGSARITRVDSAVYDSLLGKTYAEIGTEARSMHKCQGMAQLLALPGPSTRLYQLVESTIPGQLQRDERSLTDGVDTAVTALTQFAGPRVPPDLVDGLAAVSSAIGTARSRFDGESDQATIEPLIAGVRAVRALRQKLGAMQLEEAAAFEIDFRLQQKERELQRALFVASGLRIDALADDGVVVAGQDVTLSLVLANNGGQDLQVKRVAFEGFDGGTCVLTQVTSAGGFFGGRGRGRGNSVAPAPQPIATFKKGTAARCDVSSRIPLEARTTEPYWHRAGEAGRYTFDADAPFGLPFRPTPFRARVTFEFPGGEQISEDVAVQYRYEGDIFSGEKRSALLVVPALSVRATPEIAIIPSGSLRTANGGSRSQREVRVTAVNGSRAAADALVTLQLPTGWTSSTPAGQPVHFSRADESRTVRFGVTPASTTAPGEYHVRALATSEGRSYDRGYQVIEYSHIRRRHIYAPADVMMKVVDVKTPPNLAVGYVMGVGDQVPPAIEQLGAKLEYVGSEDLAWGDLSRFDVIVAGVRAYERRADLRANNSRLLEYVHNGGTLIVQYNKFEFNDAQYGPYPAKVSNNRVTDEAAPVTILAPGDPLLSRPNRITGSAWSGWVQERGLYFLDDDRDSRYRDLVQLEDPFPYNAGRKRGAFVTASYGKGHWVYVGLGLWRELPAGVDGAYQLLANLISLGKPSSAAARGR